MKLLTVLFFSVASLMGVVLGTVGLECTPTGNECLASECCGIAVFNSASYNSNTYNPLFPGKDKQICNVGTTTTWSKTDTYGVTTTYTWTCGGATGAHIIKAASMIALATSIVAYF